MALTTPPFSAEGPLPKPAMYCNLDQLLDGCLKARLKGASPPVALLIEGFPRPHHPIAEFAKLLFLLRAHGAKATFVVDWYDIRERGLCASVGQMMQLLTHNGHEVAVKFKTFPCTATQLRQQAVEALHFLQRVYGVSVVSAKVGCRAHGASAALETLGITIVNGVKEQHVVNDSADVISKVETILESLRGREFVGVSRL
jgi:hypothetical protein